MAGELTYFRQKGDPYILLTGLGLVLSLGMVILMLTLILSKGLGFFWPGDLTEIELKNGEKYLGEPWARETAYETDREVKQVQIKMGNRDILGRDFIWIRESEIQSKQFPPHATTFERLSYGNFYGFLISVHSGDRQIEGKPEYIFHQARVLFDSAWGLAAQIREQQNRLNDLVTPLTRLQREISLLQMDKKSLTPAGVEKLTEMQYQAEQLEANITQPYEQLSSELLNLQTQNEKMFVTVRTADGSNRDIQLTKIVRFFQPNRLSVFNKSRIYASKLWEFLAADPRESNTEGGVFPAIFGTVMMVLLMSIAVVPFGVLAALYLNEYARQGTVIRLIRLSVNNLAGVPSIVYGIFGLGFFIYMVGGTLDQLFFSSYLPEPTFGTGGILWASLTLALLTLPVVVVATEEGILAVPRANKEGALALGATRWQMIRKIVLPNAMPGILTGLILAISRGAGEVAPLMITGVVKLAPSLPLDSLFPFLHLDRKFMHLGFHIYDVGFQSPNVEAAKPMVYTTALLLIMIVVILNLVAIYLRNRLRKKYRTSVF